MIKSQGNPQLGWRQDNGNRSNQESKFDFQATRQQLGKIDRGQQKIKIVRTNRQSNLRASCHSIFSLCRHHPNPQLQPLNSPGKPNQPNQTIFFSNSFKSIGHIPRLSSSPLLSLPKLGHNEACQKQDKKSSRGGKQRECRLFILG